jgi:hypothetical protein
MLKPFANDFLIIFTFLLNNEIMIYVYKKMRIENFPKLKRCDHSPKREEFIDVLLDPLTFRRTVPLKLCKKIKGESKNIFFPVQYLMSLYRKLSDRVILVSFDFEYGGRFDGYP